MECVKDAAKRNNLTTNVFKLIMRKCRKKSVTSRKYLEYMLVIAFLYFL